MKEFGKWIEFRDMELEGPAFISLNSFTGLICNEDGILVLVEGQEYPIFGNNDSLGLDLEKLRMITIKLCIAVEEFSWKDKSKILDLNLEVRKIIEEMDYNIS